MNKLINLRYIGGAVWYNHQDGFKTTQTEIEQFMCPCKKSNVIFKVSNMLNSTPNFSKINCSECNKKYQIQKMGILVEK